MTSASEKTIKTGSGLLNEENDASYFKITYRKSRIDEKEKK